MLEQGYWIIPNLVLFSNEINDKQKLLYCLISSLCAEKGYCRASNEYLWEKLNASWETISKNVGILVKKWFIATDLVNWNERKITLVENDRGGSQKWLGGVVKNDDPYIYMNNTIEYNNVPFETFRAEYPHARKWKKSESKKYYDRLNSEEVMKQVHILKWKIRAWLQDWQYIPACERWIRDFTPLNEDVVKQDLVRICKWHLDAWWEMKERSHELKETFGEEEINKIVKAIQQKDSPKNLFIKQTN